MFTVRNVLKTLDRKLKLNQTVVTHRYDGCVFDTFDLPPQYAPTLCDLGDLDLCPSDFENGV